MAETNCYVDLWSKSSMRLGLAPEAMLGFTLTQDFEGDQFTFFKVPLEDLEALYGVVATELAIFDTVENHVEMQIERVVPVPGRNGQLLHAGYGRRELSA